MHYKCQLGLTLIDNKYYRLVSLCPGIHFLFLKAFVTKIKIAALATKPTNAIRLIEARDAAHTTAFCVPRIAAPSIVARQPKIN